jgi:formylglycine-generating enzyme required for sulfatase activity
MKNLVILFIALTALACIHQKPHYDVVRKQPKVKLVPPGTVWLRDNLFVDQCEISNLAYLEFLSWTKWHDTAGYSRMLPDTLVWRDLDYYFEPYVLYYLRHPAYRDYPAVGISYTQAVAYCKWRSEMVNLFLYIRDNREAVKGMRWDSIRNYPERVRYRLPSKEEWEFAAAAGLDTIYFPLGLESLSGKKNVPGINTREYQNLYNSPKPVPYYDNHELNYIPEFIDPIEPVTWGKRNKFGIYNMNGNVSEIIADSCFKGLNFETSIDGSTFTLKPGDYRIISGNAARYNNGTTFRYRKTQSWLGFRCVCDVIIP